MKTLTGITSAALCAAGIIAGNVMAQAPGPKDQFQSVVYVRKGGAPAEMYKKLRPDTLTHLYPPDFFQWGGKYMYEWFNSVEIRLKVDVDTPATDANAYEETFTRIKWDNWDKFRAAGVLTGERPAGNFDDLCFVSEEYAKALRDGTQPLPERFPKTARDGTTLCIANPDVVRIMTDIVKFDAAHHFKHGPVNGGFIDLAGIPKMDFSEFTRKKFDEWLRASYSPEQIRAILRVDPAQPIPLLTPKGASAEQSQVYERMRLEFFWNTLLPQYCRGLKESIDSVMGPGKWHFIYHGDGYWWRNTNHAYATNMVCWGDWMDSYCTECALTPYVQRGRAYYAAPDFIEPRVVNVYGNYRNCTNVYDYEYGAGRLWGEPVVVKTGYKGPNIGRSAAIVQLGLAEGLALLGNMRIDAAADTSAGRKNVPASLALPMVDFMHQVAPQVRQMIPAARVGVLFSPADSWAFTGFDKPDNDTQAYQVSNILHSQHVPLQVAHLQILEQTLARRPMDVLIVPWLRCLKDAQAAALARFVQAGGKVVFVGECGTRTWEGLPREKNAFADLLPVAEKSKVAFRQVGKGRTAFISGALDEKVESAQMLQSALFELLGHSPCCVPLEQSPLLLANLTRNSDNSRFWVHLVNYDVDFGKNDNEQPIHSLSNVRVVVPLPEGMRARSVSLYRPGQAETDVTPESGREGCAMIVPRIDVYALVAVTTEKGERPATALFSAPATAAEAASAVAVQYDAPPGGKVALVAPAAASQGPSAPAGAHRYSGGVRPMIAYVTGAAGQPVELRYWRDQPDAAPSIAVYTVDGKRVVPAVKETSREEMILTLPPLAADGHYTLVLKPAARRQTLALVHGIGLAFEASEHQPLALNEEGDSAPLYFYVPKSCKAFKLYADTQNHFPLHLVVKDGAGAVRLDANGPFASNVDWNWRLELDKAKGLDIQVPPAQAGRVWSLWFLDAAKDKVKKNGGWFCLQDVPPVVADSAAQLLIGKGDE